MIIVPKIKEVSVRQEGVRVLVISDGHAVLDLPWEVADQLGKALRVKARDAEELDKASGVAMDAAVLLRSGAPFGITSHPKIMDEARKEAQTNRDLRRFMPGGIRSRQQLGRPAIDVKRTKGQP